MYIIILKNTEKNLDFFDKIKVSIFKIHFYSQKSGDLAQEAGVNPNTMQKALMEIEKQGLIITERTSGRFVTSDSDKIQRLKDSFFELKIKNLISEFVELGCSKQDLYTLIEKHFDGVKKDDK